MPNPYADVFDLTGTVVLVTGGTKGVGLGIVETFLAAGASVAVTARNAPDAPIAVDDREPAAFFPADVRDADQDQALVAAVADRFGRLDTLVNNAGGSPQVDAATASPRFSEAVLRLNLFAPLHLAQAANAVMQQQDGGGSIVNIGSLSGVRPSPGTAAYGAAKAGLLNLSTTLAQEWAPKVRVNVVTGGYILTEQAEHYYGTGDALDRVAATVPMGRLASPGDVGEACLFLASRMARHITGANLHVDGGGERPPFLEAAKDT